MRKWSEITAGRNDPQAVIKTRLAEIEFALTEIRAKAQAYNKLTASDWGHVGDLTHVVVQLELLSEFLHTPPALLNR